MFNNPEIEKLYRQIEEKQDELDKVQADQQHVAPIGNTVAVVAGIIWLLTLFSMSVPWIVFVGAIIFLPAMVLRTVLRHGASMQVKDLERDIAALNRKIGETW